MKTLMNYKETNIWNNKWKLKMLKIKIILEYCIQPVKYMKYKIKVLLLNHQLQKQLIKTLIIKRSNLTNKMIQISRKILIVARIKMLQIINTKHPGNSIRHYQITNQFLNPYKIIIHLSKIQKEVIWMWV